MSYELELNKSGSLIGIDTKSGIKRVAAHLYEVPSRSKPDEVHKVYVETLFPTPFYRCQCMIYLVTGSCDHGFRASSFELRIAVDFQETYLEELIRREQKRLKNIKED